MTWYNERVRHGLSARGIKTSRYMAKKKYFFEKDFAQLTYNPNLGPSWHQGPDGKWVQINPEDYKSMNMGDIFDARAKSAEKAAEIEHALLSSGPSRIARAFGPTEKALLPPGVSTTEPVNMDTLYVNPLGGDPLRVYDVEGGAGTRKGLLFSHETVEGPGGITAYKFGAREVVGAPPTASEEMRKFYVQENRGPGLLRQTLSDGRTIDLEMYYDEPPSVQMQFELGLSPAERQAMVDALKKKYDALAEDFKKSARPEAVAKMNAIGSSMKRLYQTFDENAPLPSDVAMRVGSLAKTGAVKTGEALASAGRYAGGYADEFGNLRADWGVREQMLGQHEKDLENLRLARRNILEEQAYEKAAQRMAPKGYRFEGGTFVKDVKPEPVPPPRFHMLSPEQVRSDIYAAKGYDAEASPRVIGSQVKLMAR